MNVDNGQKSKSWGTGSQYSQNHLKCFRKIIFFKGKNKKQKVKGKYNQCCQIQTIGLKLFDQYSAWARKYMKTISCNHKKSIVFAELQLFAWVD